MSFWPSHNTKLDKFSKEPVELLEFCMRANKTRFVFEGIRFKVHESTKYLSAFQFLFTGGYASHVIKAANETEDGMTTVTLAGRKLGRVLLKRVDKMGMLETFYLSNGQIFA